ncbi:FecCD family ABC transporter permease [Brooklawnia cerclae]|uniref:Iron complex transport system permease protein n=1 Tax=Brooklawnia cerclae TaxID=349934 RepID=A0ABX0SBL7_9ACTN|nr:iron ABC transporter permease [Brooklawnia cerclae]NIH55420.1 iron complex transport system permease protein [Brooklawnia cerclae]
MNISTVMDASRAAPVRRVLVLPILAVALVVAAAVGIAAGNVGIPVADVASILAQSLGLHGGADHTLRDVVVVTQIRTPRVVIAALVGASLGVAGAAMQGVFRNPLAEPGVVGVSSGGALGAVIALSSGLTAFGSWVLPVFAFTGSALTIGLVFGIQGISRRNGTATLLLVGIALNALLGAVISVLVATADNDDQLRGIVFWLQGGLDARTWEHVRMVVVPLLVGLVAITAFSRDLNVFGLGDDQARSAGVDVARTRTVILLLAALLIGVSVAVSGTISFVGVVVPHAVRLVIGPDHRTLMPASALGGATFLVLADLIARTAFEPVVLQVGVVTALVGAPVLLYFIVRSPQASR